MSDETARSSLRGRSSGWDWWSENPAEIVLVVFLLTAFFFFTWLPPQGWGIDPSPNVSEPVSASANAGD